MTPSTRRKRPPEELVELAPGSTIRAEFLSRGSTGGPLGSYSLRIRTDPETRVPTLVDFSLHFSEPPPIRSLTNDHIRLLAEQAISQEAVSVATERLMDGHRFAVSDDFEDHFPEVTVPAGVLRLPSAELRRVAAETAEAVRPKPGRRPVPDEMKVRILEFWQAQLSVVEPREAMERTIEEFDLAERTLRRYFAAAKRIKATL